MGLPCPRPSLTAPACPLSPALQAASTMLLFFLLEQKWSYISYRNLLPGAKGDLRKISLASVLAELLAGVPRRRALAVPSQGLARFLACSPWSGQPLFWVWVDHPILLPCSSEQPLGGARSHPSVWLGQLLCWDFWGLSLA